MRGRPRLRAAEGAESGEVGVLAFGNNTQESRGVADLIEHLIKDEELPPGEILVLFRGDHAGQFSSPPVYIHGPGRSRSITSRKPCG